MNDIILGWETPNEHEKPFWRDGMSPEEYDIENEYLGRNFSKRHTREYFPLWRQKIMRQILSYLYDRAVAGEPVDPDMISRDAMRFKVEERYWCKIMYALLCDGYIAGIQADNRLGTPERRIIIEGLQNCRITEKGIALFQSGKRIGST